MRTTRIPFLLLFIRNVDALVLFVFLGGGSAGEREGGGIGAEGHLFCFYLWGYALKIYFILESFCCLSKRKFCVRFLYFICNLCVLRRHWTERTLPSVVVFAFFVIHVASVEFSQSTTAWLKRGTGGLVPRIRSAWWKRGTGGRRHGSPQPGPRTCEPTQFPMRCHRRGNRVSDGKKKKALRSPVKPRPPQRPSASSGAP